MLVVKDETNKVVLQRLIDLIGSLQLKFLRKYKIPIRGGITRGQIYLDDEIVFGAGLVEAVNLESHKAIYPRMVIDSKLYSDEHLTENLNNVKIDFDGQRYIDYFSLLTVSDIYSPKPDEKKEVCEVRNSVFDLVEKYGHYDKRETRPEKIDENTKNILKYLWIVMKYNEVVVAKGFPTQIKYDISISEKFMRFELTNLRKNPWPVIAN
ncbi:MAG: hypothetical protein J5738_07955 [Lachnospiraceae bacterium]|nr:hypothetical protein [Lachnospiraceae bacterium]